MNIRAGFRALTVASGAALLLIAGSGAASADDPVEAETAISCVKKIDSGKYRLIYPWVRVKNGCA
ncbi:hypothetical protein [Nonomuraea sp. NEAU-A123]|uniref:hypothetical protein n=1 Tax=Nonomuraea sp. NEAU-A123 TaxID=2839649 RepID=UPI001BE4C427|nr:hypothetical protein [Nonomuraea sp. NEAU-A123]MBT2224696.1 hypothetical protein [Nonomuraea sp. NEAU-A123]